MKRTIFLATAALLAMLILAPIAMGQAADYPGGVTRVGIIRGFETTMVNGSPVPKIPVSGGPNILLPATALLLGSGILTYVILRRR